MRITNNEENSNPKDPNDDVYYIVYDTDTEEYLTDWDTDQDSGEIQFQQWQEVDFWAGEVHQDIRKFDTAVLSYSRKSADKLLINVAADLCDRFPDERINLQVRQLTVKIHRTVDVEDVGEVQTFGGEDELLDEEEWAAQPAPKRYDPVEESPSKPKKEKKSARSKTKAGSAKK